MTQTIYWHDYETFGANPATDRPSQFAGIRTNMDLELVGDPLMIYCQPIPDLLPAPDACLITRITPQKASKEGVPEPEFISKIQAEFIQPQTCVAGYNSLRFDDEVTRYTLYRNFYDPYAREWQNGNSRWDIIDMVRLVYALRPDSLNWPEREPGVPSFKLELLSQANGLQHESAHDALSDVIATIELAKLIRKREPKLYEFCWGLRNKAAVSSKIDAGRHKPLLHISSKIPASRGCATIVMPLVAHPINKNAIICADLCADPSPLFEMDGETIKQRLYTPHSELPEDEQRIPLKAIHINRCPVVLPLQMLDEENAKRLHIDMAEAEKNWQKLLAEPSVAGKAEFAFKSEFEGEEDADSALYQGFLSNQDRHLADELTKASPDLLADRNFVFSDWRMNELLQRYKARHFPESLNEQERLAWNEQVRERFFKPVEKYSGESELEHYRNDLQDRLKQDLPEGQKVILIELLDWSEELSRRFREQ